MTAADLLLQPDPDDTEGIDVLVDGFVGDDAVRFRLDTGAGRCRVVDSESVRSLPTAGSDAGFGASGTWTPGEDEIVIDRLRIDGAEIHDVVATRTPPGADAFPLLGMSALGRWACGFEFSARRLVLATSGDESIESIGWQPLVTHPFGQPTVPLSFDEVDVTAIWDTGASLTAVDQTFADEHPSLLEPQRESTGFDASGVEMVITIARMSEITVAGRRFEPSACAIVDLGPLNDAFDRRASSEGMSHEPMSVILGMPAIARADWWFDFPARRWALASS